MSIIDTLITDRNQADIANQEALEAKIKAKTATVSEVAEYYLGQSRGSYNATDLNRVGEALIYLAERLTELDYPVTVNPKTNWIKTAVPTPAQLTTYLSLVQKIRDVLPVLPDTPQVPTDISNDMTLEESNAIEQILVDIDTLINNMIAAYIYCGQITCGQLTQFGGGF